MACVSPSTARGVAEKGSALLEVAVPSLPTSSRRCKENGMPVIIGMDPHKRSTTIEVITEFGAVVTVGKFGTDQLSFAEMLVAGRRFSDRVWAVEGSNGVGRPVAQPAGR